MEQLMVVGVLRVRHIIVLLSSSDMPSVHPELKTQY
jgi:hypothetical protein